jgi:hypothetical protein
MVNEMRDINTPLLKEFIEESRKYLDEMETFMFSNLDEDKYKDEVERIGALGLVNKHKSEQILEHIQPTNRVKLTCIIGKK